MTFSKITGVAFLFLAVALLWLANAPVISNPPFDRHSFRQSQTLSTIELYYRDGIDLLHPATNYQGEPGYFVLELPLFQAAAALLFRVFGDSIAVVRIFNILITLASCGMTYLISRKLLSPIGAMVAALIFISAPLNLGYMAAVLLDPLGIFCALSTFYVGWEILEGRRSTGRYVLFGVLACLVALIKALYLFPVLVLMGVWFLSEGRKAYRPLAVMFAWLVVAGVGFLAWSWHAKSVNNASFFTAGVLPTSHLGYSMLTGTAWYKVIAKRLLWDCVGPLAGILIVVGWVCSGITTTRTGNWRGERIALLTLGVTVGYWFAFADINYPHDYYSLVTVPFLSIAAAAAIQRLTQRREALVVAIGLCTVGVSAVFYAKKRWAIPSEPLMTLQREAGQSFHRWDYAMVFVDHAKCPSVTPGNEFPAGLYALGLRGTGKCVASANQAVEIFQRFAPHYQHLQYVVFYGMEPVPHIANGFPHTVVSNATEQIYGFEVAPVP